MATNIQHKYMHTEGCQDLERAYCDSFIDGTIPVSKAKPKTQSEHKDLEPACPTPFHSQSSNWETSSDHEFRERASDSWTEDVLESYTQPEDDVLSVDSEPNSADETILRDDPLDVASVWDQVPAEHLAAWNPDVPSSDREDEWSNHFNDWDLPSQASDIEDANASSETRSSTTTTTSTAFVKVPVYGICDPACQILPASEAGRKVSIGRKGVDRAHEHVWLMVDQDRWDKLVAEEAGDHHFSDLAGEEVDNHHSQDPTSTETTTDEEKRQKSRRETGYALEWTTMGLLLAVWVMIILVVSGLGDAPWFPNSDYPIKCGFVIENVATLVWIAFFEHWCGDTIPGSRSPDVEADMLAKSRLIHEARNNRQSPQSLMLESYSFLRAISCIVVFVYSLACTAFPILSKDWSKSTLLLPLLISLADIGMIIRGLNEKRAWEIEHEKKAEEGD